MTLYFCFVVQKQKEPEAVQSLESTVWIVLIFLDLLVPPRLPNPENLTFMLVRFVKTEHKFSEGQGCQRHYKTSLINDSEDCFRFLIAGEFCANVQLLDKCRGQGNWAIITRVSSNIHCRMIMYCTLRLWTRACYKLELQSIDKSVLAHYQQRLSPRLQSSRAT